MMGRVRPKIELMDKSKLVLSNFKLIPTSLFKQVIKLFELYAEQNLECLVYVHWDLDKQEYLLTVPKQIVSKECIVIDNQLNLIDLVTGNVVKTNNLVKLGSIHSHHSMPPEFSYTDDLSDLTGGTAIHIVLGLYPKWEINSSIVKSGTRYLINSSYLLSSLNIDCGSMSLPYKVINYITTSKHE